MERELRLLLAATLLRACRATFSFLRASTKYGDGGWNSGLGLFAVLGEARFAVPATGLRNSALFAGALPILLDGAAFLCFAWRFEMAFAIDKMAASLGATPRAGLR